MASEVRYRRLFETAKDGILLLDADTGRITDVNPFLEELLGYSHKELIAKALWEIGPVKDIAASQQAMHELQHAEYIRYEDLPLETKGGQRMQVEFVSNVYLVDGLRVIQCNIRDITARKHAEAEAQIDDRRDVCISGGTAAGARGRGDCGDHCFDRTCGDMIARPASGE